MKISNPRGDNKSRKGDPVDPKDVKEDRLGLRREIFTFLGLFVFAFTVRLLYLYQIESIPLFYHLPGDARGYDTWAQRIAAGDWLGKGVFYQAPLYPYFLGFLQLILGHDLWLIRVVQIILGAMSCSLLCLAGRLFFSPRAGLVAGLLLSVYAPAVYFDALIEKAVLDLLSITAMLALLASNLSRPHWLKWAGAGLFVALLGLSRENALILSLVVPIWIWLYFKSHPSRIRFGWTVIFAAGVMVILLPVGLRNLRVGDEFTLTTSQLGPNFFIGNNPLADGTYASIRAVHGEPQFERREATRIAEQALGRRLSPGEVSSYWLRQSWDYIRSQPLNWLRLLGKKWLIVWNIHEIEDSDDFYLYQRYSWLLKVLGSISHFALLAPLAAVGAFLTWREWRRLWLLYAMLLALASSLVLFYVFGRYRFSMVPLLAIFAGVAIVKAYDLWREGGLKRLAPSTAVFVGVALLVHFPVIGRTGPSAPGYNNLANALVKQGRASEAIQALKQALVVQPTYGVAHFNLGNLYASEGKPQEAIHHLREAVRLYPRFAEARNNLGKILINQGEVESAIKEFRQALEVNPSLAGVHLNLGIALGRQGRIDDAIDYFQQGLRVQPESAPGYYNLGIALAAKGQLARAVENFRQALRINPSFVEAHEGIGRALAQQGKRDEAVQHYQEALRILRSRREPTVPQ